MSRHAVFVLAALALSCGYRPLRSGLAGAPKIRVVSAETQVAGAAQVPVAEELATGARAELARFGALADAADDRLRLEIVRLDEQSEGVEVVEGRPRARGVRLRLVARGAIAGPRGEWETPDVEATELVPAVTDPLAWDAARGAAARAVARRAGALVAREVLGIP